MFNLAQFLVLRDAERTSFGALSALHLVSGVPTQNKEHVRDILAH